MKQKSLPAGRQGFTLIEVLVVAVIITVLTSVGFASYSRVTMRSRDSKRKSDIEQIRSALEIYRADNGSYPTIVMSGTGWTNASGLVTVLVPTYIPAIPTDPKNVSPSNYRLSLTNAIGGKYYGYCLSALIESETNPVGTCTPDTGQNYGVKSP